MCVVASILVLSRRLLHLFLHMCIDVYVYRCIYIHV